MRYPDLLATARDRKRYQRYRAERGQFVHDCVDMLIAAWRVLDEKTATTTDPACATILMQIRNVLEALIKQHPFCKSGFSEVGHLASMVR